MEFIENNMILLFSIFMMLFGAFVIGYFFGNLRVQKEITIEHTKEKEATKESLEIQKSSSELDSEDTNRTELFNINEPGKIRATKTRERTGELSGTLKDEVAMESIDFTLLDLGNKFHPDDFKKIVGIGSVVEKKLHEAGIYNYSQLAQMTYDDIQDLTRVIQFFPGRIDRDNWKGQAQELMNDEENETGV